ncbi:MAG: HAD family phosphatase [Pseudomonadota bacterium]
MTEIKLIIFDCDGVLVDSEYLAAKHELQTYSAFGFEMSVEQFAAEFAGMSSDLVFKEVEERLGRNLPEDLLEKMQNELDDVLKSEVEMIEGADSVLDRFDLPRCICSNSGPERLKIMLQKTGLYDRFRPYIFSSRDLKPHAPKPKPDIFLKAIDEFGVNPAEALVVEDSVHGVMAARLAGARIVGFTGGRHSYPAHGDQLQDAGAETVIAGFGSLPAVVDAFSEWAGIGAA